MSGPLERLRPPLHVDAINEVLAGQDSMMAMILRNEGDGCSHIVAQMLSDDDAHDICEIVNTSADLRAQLTAATRRAEQAEKMLAEWVTWVCGQDGPSPFHETNNHLATIRSAASGEQGEGCSD